MFKLRPQIKINYGRVNSPIRIPLRDLFIGASESFLTNDFASGVSALTVKNIYGFAINQILFIGQAGVESSEFVKTHGSTAPTGSTVALSAATTQPHANSDQVYIVQYDQVEISYSGTLTGTKTVLTTQNLDVADETIYYDNTISTGFYFARYKNSITSTFSDYSDGCPIRSYAMNTSRFIIDTALAEINKVSSDLFSDEYGFSQINKCQMEVLREQKRWSWMQALGATTEASTGMWRIPVPSDLDDQNTNKSTLNFRLGTDSNMTFVDKEEWDGVVQGIKWSTLGAVLNVSDATITLSDSSNFDASGTIQLGSDTLSYTANDTTTGILTLSAVSTVTYAVGFDVFQGATLGSPTYFTINTGYLWHYPVVDSLHDKKDYSLDYYMALTPITSDTDTIVVPDPVLVIDYLRWKFLKRQNNGEETNGSLEAKDCFVKRRDKLVQKEVMTRKIVLKPRYNNYSRLSSFDGDSKNIRTQGFWN